MRTVAATGKMWSQKGKRYLEVTKYEDGKIASVRSGWKLEEAN